MQERTNIYVTVSDVRACDALTEDQVTKRRKQVSTEQNLIVMHADDEVACKKLRDLIMQNKLKAKQICDHSTHTNDCDDEGTHMSCTPREP